MGFRLRCRLALERLRVPRGVPFLHAVGGFLIPGAAFWFRGLLLIGTADFLAALILLTVALVFLGNGISNLGFGLLISVHAVGLIYLFEPWLVGRSFGARVALSLAMVILLSGFLYLPVRNFVQSHWAMPLQSNGRIVIVQVLPQTQKGKLIAKRGEWLAYTVNAESKDGVYILGGYGLGQVLAGPGDKVRFTAGAVEINGVAQARALSMPRSGDVIVPEKHWFIWPDFAIGGHGYGPDASSVLLRMAMIPEQQLVGKPFKRWFWRRQVPA